MPDNLIARIRHTAAFGESNRFRGFYKGANGKLLIILEKATLLRPQNRVETYGRL